MNLLIDYFEPKDIVRHSEYLTCLHKNLGNQYINKIYLFISDDTKLNFESNKLEIVRVSKRPTFKDFFEFANTLSDICIVANADIFLDDTLRYALDIKNDFVALTRWDIKKDLVEHFNCSVSQDTWIFRPPIKVPDVNFTLGTWGNDNKIARIMNDLGYNVKNPSLQIRTYHLHLSPIRDYQIKPVPPPYMGLIPNDDINKDTEKIMIKEFNNLGQAIIE